jgi:hypothetical protein
MYKIFFLIYESKMRSSPRGSRQRKELYEENKSYKVLYWIAVFLIALISGAAFGANHDQRQA